MHLKVAGLYQHYTGEVEVYEIDSKQQIEVWVEGVLSMLN